MKKIIILLMCMLFLNSCALTEPYQVKTLNDAFDGYTINQMTYNYLVSNSGIVELNIKRLQTKDGRISYYLVVEYQNSDWLFIEGGESLILLVDGERIGFKGDGSLQSRNVGSSGWIDEKAVYDINPKILNQIANAKEVKVKIIGNQYYIECKFTEQSFQNFKKFIAEYITGTSGGGGNLIVNGQPYYSGDKKK